MKIWILIIHSTKRIIGHVGASLIKLSGSVFFWWNEAVKVTEATEVVEAVEVIDAAETLRHGKSSLRTLESRGSWIQLYFDVFKKLTSIEVAEAGEVKEAAEVTEAWKTITEDFRVIKVLEFSFILMF